MKFILLVASCFVCTTSLKRFPITVMKKHNPDELHFSMKEENSNPSHKTSSFNPSLYQDVANCRILKCIESPCTPCDEQRFERHCVPMKTVDTGNIKYDLKPFECFGEWKECCRQPAFDHPPTDVEPPLPILILITKDENEDTQNVNPSLFKVAQIDTGRADVPSHWSLKYSDKTVYSQ